MSYDSLIAPLVRLPLFAGLSGELLRSIASVTERVVFERGQEITTQDSPGDAAFVIVRGRADRIAGTGRAGETLPQGALVGEMTMLTETSYPSTIVATETVRALRISREAMHALMMEHPDLAAHFIARINERLQELSRELREIEIPPLVTVSIELDAPRLAS